MQENEKQASVPYFIHEGDMARMDMAMDRMVTAMDKMKYALRTVCLTLVLVVLLFVVAYSRNNDMVDKLRGMMQDAPDERSRQELQKLIGKMENM